jgi:hypothetical protein
MASRAATGEDRRRCAPNNVDATASPLTGEIGTMSDQIPDGGRPPTVLRGRPHRERRLWQRYAAGGSRAALIWLVGASERAALGELLDIGGGGAAFVSETVPPSHLPIWLRPAADAPRANRIEPAESRLVWTSDGRAGTTIAHLEFVAPCPMKLFALVTNRTG